MGKKVSNIRVSEVTAPYNFIPFEDKTIPVKKEQMTVRGSIDDSLVSGDLTYTVEAKTPIFIDDGKTNFYRDEYCRQAIPGTTMRGLVRANAQVLGVASHSDDIDDYRLMFRNVANGAERDRYNKNILGSKTVPVGDGATINVLKNVRAGYITKKNGRYQIYGSSVKSLSPEFGEMNYYIVSERNIAKRYKDKEFAFFKKHPNFTQNCLDTPFKKMGEGKRAQYIGEQNRQYMPFYAEISYSVKDKRFITAIGEKGEYENDGCLLGSGHMRGKKALYVIPSIDTSEMIEVDKSSVDDFQRDLNARKNTIKKNLRFFSLPENGEVKPVFYIRLNGKLYFGFTPRLRLFYDHTIMEGYRVKSDKFDYVKSIFGCLDEKMGYKSKVSFADAIIDGKDAASQMSKVVLGEPKPTSYLDYLKQSPGSDPATYNTERFDLRGTKKYWMHNNIEVSESNGNEKTLSTINALPAGTRFIGKVRFQNLTRAELGLLLWSLRLEDHSEVNIGKAKALGYGRCKVNISKVRIFDPKKAYSVDSLSLEPFNNASDPLEYIGAYKEEAGNKLGKDIMQLASVKALIIMSDKDRIPDSKLTRYMPLKGYQNRVTDLVPLPTPEEVITGHSAPRAGAEKDKTGTTSGNENKQKNVIRAKVFAIDDFGNIMLSESPMIARFSRILAKNAGGRKVSVGDEIDVCFVGDQANSKGRVWHHYVFA